MSLYVSYRKQNKEDNTLLNFFDDTISIDVEKTDTNSSLINTFRYITKLIGSPRNYGNNMLFLLDKWTYSVFILFPYTNIFCYPVIYAAKYFYYMKDNCNFLISFGYISSLPFFWFGLQLLFPTCWWFSYLATNVEVWQQKIFCKTAKLSNYKKRFNQNWKKKTQCLNQFHPIDRIKVLRPI